MVDVVDFFQVWVLHQRDLIKARHDLTHCLKRWVQGTKGLHVGLGAHVFIVIKDRDAVDVTHVDN